MSGSAENNRKYAHLRNAYNARTYDSIMVRFKRDGSDQVTKNQIKAAAKRSGQSVNAWILDAIREAL